ncbi:MAG: type II toxin-antitoxin system RelE/ParE family toxin [Bacteroides sp.]|nr:type II toxin-antitoxin system RelE/ParE family toxin [Bacteroides sp.]
MIYNLIISQRAEERIDSLLDYLLEEWGYNVQQRFLDELIRCFSIIKNNPYSFPFTQQNHSVRQCVVTPLNKLYYTIIEDDVLVLSLEDVRMNPDKSIFI